MFRINVKYLTLPKTQLHLSLHYSSQSQKSKGHSTAMTLDISKDYVTTFSQDCLTCLKLKHYDKNMETPSFNHCRKHPNPLRSC